MSKLQNSIFFFDQFHQESSEKFVSEILERVENGVTDITVYINSYGGSVNSVNAVLDCMDKVKKENGVSFTTVALGIAASGGAYLLINGDKRYVSKNTSVMTHGVQAFLFGSEKEIGEQMSQIRAINERFATLVSQRTQMTYEEAYAFLSEDVSMTAEQSVEKGLVDEIWDVESEIQRILEEVSIAASAEYTDKGNGEIPISDRVVEANNFLKSLKQMEGKMPEAVKKPDAGSQTEFELKFKELNLEYNTLKLEHDKLVLAFDAKVKELNDFRVGQKEAVIKKVEKAVPKDKQAEVRAELEDVKDSLELERFEKFAEKVAKYYSVAAVTKGVVTKTETEEKKTELEIQLDAEVKEIIADGQDDILRASYGIKN